MLFRSESSASAITRNAADRFARLERCLFPFDFLAVRVDDALLFPLYTRFCSELASDTATQPEKKKRLTSHRSIYAACAAAVEVPARGVIAAKIRFTYYEIVVATLRGCCGALLQFSVGLVILDDCAR